ncbi:MAG: two-component sensor histidine kinase, partial [Propionicimonas sp.]|nr:two-component sensor histidine kinase [Propionicimonas sp.]
MSGRWAWFAPLKLWARSLPFRVVVITIAASIAILTATGLFLLDQSTKGILAGKTQASVAEASAVVQVMQRDLNATDLRTTSVNERITRLAREATNRGQVGDQYFVVVETPLSLVATSGLDPASIPDRIRTAMATGDGLLSTPTLITFTDGREPEPGLVV